jgi:formylglycine-generating enzyme required for sulfatase activity
MRYAVGLIVVVSLGLPAIETGPAQAEAELAPGRVFHDCADVCPEMVVVPAGSFMMGSPSAEIAEFAKEALAERTPFKIKLKIQHFIELFQREGPQHGVTIARPFAVGRFEVTFAEWDACVSAGGCTHRPGDSGWGRGRRPVMSVSWNDTQEYTSWLSRRTGKTYRLLSEAEWEYAARAGSTTRYHFGDRE